MENEFDAPENGVKQLREALDRKDEQNKKLEAELASYKEKEIPTLVEQGVSEYTSALKQVYDGPVNAESITQFAKDEYGFEPTGQVQDVTQPEPEPVVQDDARARVAALDANSTSVMPQGLDEQLANVMKNGTVKDQLRAKLNIMDQDKK